MSQQENLRLIRQIHEPKEGQGLLERMDELNALADNVEWWVAGPSDILPWAGSFRGREEVARWFQSLRETMEYQQFEPREFIASGDTVVVIASAKGRARESGVGFESDIVRVWTLRDGKVIKARSYFDTYSYVQAIRGTNHNAEQPVFQTRMGG